MKFPQLGMSIELEA
jgi:hypothetical protein